MKNIKMIDEKTRKYLINSIRYAILKYRETHNKEPNCIMLNKCAYDILTADWNLILQNNLMSVIYGMPIRLTREATDDINCPRFWLCEEGTIYNYDIDGE